MDLGFKPQNAALAKFELNQAGYSSEAADHLQRRLLERVSQLPGVLAAGYANTTPLNQDASFSAVFSQQTSDLKPSNKAFTAYDFDVSPGYFTAAGTPLIEGRAVSFSDTAKMPLVAVVNQHFARLLFHSEHAVGRYFKNLKGVSVQIVGIVADGKYLTLSEDQEPAAFFPISQEGATKTSLVVRMRPDSRDGAVNDMAATMRKVVRDLDSSVPIRESSAWSGQLGLTFFLSQVATAALGLFGAFDSENPPTSDRLGPEATPGTRLSGKYSAQSRKLPAILPHETGYCFRGNKSMPKANQTFSPAQTVALTRLLAGDTVTKAAETAGVHRGTLNRWMNYNASFRATFDNAQSEHLMAFQCKLHTLAEAAVEAIHSVLSDTKASPNARLKAAQLVIHNLKIGQPAAPGNLKQVHQILKAAENLETPHISVTRFDPEANKRAAYMTVNSRIEPAKPVYQMHSPADASKCDTFPVSTNVAEPAPTPAVPAYKSNLSIFPAASPLNLAENTGSEIPSSPLPKT